MYLNLIKMNFSIWNLIVSGRNPDVKNKSPLDECDQEEARVSNLIRFFDENIIRFNENTKILNWNDIFYFKIW